MQVKFLNTEESENKVAAYQEARIRSYAASTHYTASEKLVAERIRMCLELVYYARDTYINYRKRFIAIKLDDARVTDRKGLKDLEQDLELRGAVKVITAQGITYRIPKVAELTV